MRERDVWNMTIYHRAIRKKMGEALRGLGPNATSAPRDRHTSKST
jgi:hypothetical protein